MFMLKQRENCLVRLFFGKIKVSILKFILIDLSMHRIFHDIYRISNSLNILSSQVLGDCNDVNDDIDKEMS